MFLNLKQLVKAFVIICWLVRLKAQNFDAYDCRTTTKTRLVPYDKDATPCMDVSIDRDEARKVNATLIQDDGEEHYIGYKCVYFESRQVTTCGWAHHTTPVLRMSYANKKIHVAEAHCRQAHSSGTFTTNEGFVFPVQREGVTTLTADVVGSSYISNGYAYCSGGTYKHDNETVYNAMVNLELTLTIEPISVRSKGNEIIEEKANVRLPCSIKEETCESDQERLMWYRSNQVCTAAQARHFTGLLLTEKGNLTITSVDNSMIYLTLGEEIKKCGVKVRKTQLDDITVLIQEEGQNKTYKEFSNNTVTMNALEMAEFVEDRDAFMVHQLKRYIDFEDRKIQHKQCLMDQQFGRMIPILNAPEKAAQQAWRVRDNIFARHAGEAYYVFECKLTQVRARETKQCYEELPVTDVFQFDQEMFLNVETRELTAKGTPRPCAEYMHKVIKSTDGKWIQLTPKPSEGLTPVSWAPHRLTWKLVESVAGGIFSQREMHEAMNEHDRRIQHLGNGKRLNNLVDNQYSDENIKWRGNWFSRQGHALEEDVEGVTGSVAAWFANLWYEGQVIFYAIITILGILITLCACFKCRLYKLCTYYGPKRSSRPRQTQRQPEEPPIIRREARINIEPRIVEIDDALNDAWEQATQLNREANPDRTVALPTSRRPQARFSLTPY